MHTQPPILRLPNELLLHIVSFLSDDKDLASLLQTNQFLQHIVEAYIFQNDRCTNNGHALPFYAKYGLGGSLQKMLSLVTTEDEATYDDEDLDYRTAMSYIAENGDLALWQILLDHDARLGRKRNLAIDSEESYPCRTALSWAMQGGQIEFAQYLVKYGADLDAKCKEKRSHLSYAAERGHLAGVRWFLEQVPAELKWCYVDLEDHDGLKPLHYAAFEGNEEIVELLISAGAHTDDMTCNRGDELAQTPLMEAARGGQLAVVKMLLDTGADVEAHDGSGMGPLHYAARAGVGEPLRPRDGIILTTFMDGHPGPGEYFDGAGYEAPSLTGNPRDYLAVVKLLLSSGADPQKSFASCHGAPESCPLYFAAWAGASDIVKILIDAGVDVDDEPEYIRGTALHAAVRNGHLEVVQILLAHGVNVNSRGVNNHSALDRARFAARLVEQGKSSYHEEAIWFRKEMSLFEANLSKYQQIVDVLVAHGGEFRVGVENFDPW